MSANAAALTELLIRERKPLLCFLARYLDRASCEDTYQSMYFKLAAVPGEPPIEDTRAYLYRVAYHQVVDRTRAERRQQRALAEAAQLLAADAIDHDSRSLHAQIELRRLTALVLGLPEPTQRIFLLNRYHGMPERQIAALLGVSKSLVAKHVRRALQRLEAQLGDQ